MASETEYPLSLVIKAVDKATGPLRAVNAELKAFKSPLGVLKAFSKESGFSDIGKSATRFGSALGRVKNDALALAKTVAGLGIAAGFGLYAFTKSAVDAGDELGELSQRFGTSVDFLASYRFAAEQADVSQEGFNSGLDTFVKGLGQAKAGTGKLLSFLNKVSPTLANQIKNANSTEQALSLMTTAFERVEDPARRAALAAVAFGDKQFGQFLGQGSKAIQEQQAEYLKLVGSQDKFASSAGALDNVLRKNEVAFLGLRNAAATALFPAFTKLSEATTKFLTANQDKLATWATKAGDAIVKWVDGGGMERLATSLGNIASVASGLIDKLGGVEGVAKIVAIAMSANLAKSTATATFEFARLGVDILGFMGKTSGFSGWIIGWTKYLWMMRASIAAGLIPSIVGLVAPLATAATAAWAFVAPMLIAAAPILAVVAAVAALAWAGYEIYKNWEPIKGLFADLWQTITFYANEAWLKIKPIVDGIKGVFGGNTTVTSSQTMTGAMSSPPPVSSAAQSNVTVSIANAPPGTRVSADKNVSTDVSYSMGPAMASY